MRLFRFGEPGAERQGVELQDGTRLDVSGQFEDFRALFMFPGAVQAGRQWFANEAGRYPRVDPTARFGPPIPRPPAIIAVGLNYKEHARESGAELPKEPVLFTKHPGTFAGPHDDVPIPNILDLSGDAPALRRSTTTDYEVELGVVIGQTAYCIKREEWQKYVAGFVVVNDVSERETQIHRSGTWDKGKGFPGFSPVGPYLMPQDAVNPANLKLWLKVNDELRQSSSTADMAFPVDYLVWYASHFYRLEPGTLITTGTPQGVGMGFKPTRYLTHGDVVTLGIEGLGTMQHRFVGE